MCYVSCDIYWRSYSCYLEASAELAKWYNERNVEWAEVQRLITGRTDRFPEQIQFTCSVYDFSTSREGWCLRGSEFLSEYVKVVLIAVVPHDVRAAGYDKPYDLPNCVGQLGSSRLSSSHGRESVLRCRRFIKRDLNTIIYEIQPRRRRQMTVRTSIFY
jgi:hypothetical protein